MIQQEYLKNRFKRDFLQYSLLQEGSLSAKEKGRALLKAYPQLSQRDATLKICPISIEPRADLPSDMKEVYNFEVI